MQCVHNQRNFERAVVQQHQLVQALVAGQDNSSRHAVLGHTAGAAAASTVQASSKTKKQQCSITHCPRHTWSRPPAPGTGGPPTGPAGRRAGMELLVSTHRVIGRGRSGWGCAAGCGCHWCNSKAAATCHLRPTSATVPAALQAAAHLVLLALLALADLGAHEAALLRMGGGGRPGAHEGMRMPHVSARGPNQPLDWLPRHPAGHHCIHVRFH